MGLKFEVYYSPSREELEQLASLEPRNALYTPGYLTAFASAYGWKLLILGVREDGKWVFGSPGFLRKGTLNQSLQINSIPTLSLYESQVKEAFFQELPDYCRQEGILTLSLHTWGCTEGDLPRLPGEQSRSCHRDYILDLNVPNLWSQLRSGHKNNITRARKAGVVMKRDCSMEACRIHGQLRQASMTRRRERGEKVGAELRLDLDEALIQSGGAEIYQAVLGDRVLSSFLMLRAERSYYHHTAGTCPEGMQLGSSHFLMYEVLTHFQQEKKEFLNMGQVDSWNEGLARFKEGFRAVAIQRYSSECLFGGKWRLKAGEMGRQIFGLLKKV